MTDDLAAQIKAPDTYLHDLEDRHLHNKRSSEDDAFKWNQVIRIVGNLTLRLDRDRKIKAELRAQIEDDIRSLTPYDLPNSQIGVSIFSVLDIIKQRIDSTEASE